MGLFSVSALVLLAFIYWATGAYISRQTDATIEEQITGLAERYELSELQGLIRAIEQRLRQNPTGSSLYFLAGSDSRRIVGNLDRWPSQAPSADGWIEFTLRGDASDGEFNARARVFRLRGNFRLLVGRDLQELKAFQRLVAQTLGWGVAVTLLLALLGGFMMSRSTVRRIEAINDTSREIISGDLGRRIPTQGSGDDFDQLAENLNGMLEQIETLMDGVRSVSDSIAHDLKTPLTRLRNRLERASRVLPENDDIQSALEEADQLLTSFKAALRIARIESGTGTEHFAELRLDELINDVCDLYEPLASDKQQSLKINLVPVGIVGDRDLLFQAFANLLDNAVKYTPETGQIHVEMFRHERWVDVCFEDTGPGIAPKDREKVLERFSRLEESRHLPGNGLGLSLVHAVAALHRAKLQLKGDTGGLHACLKFSTPANHTT